MSSNALTKTFIPLSEPTLAENSWTYVKEALDSGWVSSGGPHITTFEKRCAEYLGVPRTVATSSGTAALHIALILAGVQPGDEVIVPSLTFIATVNAIRYVGAIPVFWDAAPDHFNADSTLLQRLITPKTKAVVVVHLYGQPVDMGPVLAVAKTNNLRVIEDAAEALGAAWQGQYCGTIGDIGCLSFNGNKVITTGGGGMLISRDTDLMARAHYLINQAKDNPLDHTHDEIGYNYRLTNLQAALGLAQFDMLPEFLAARRAITLRYREALEQHPAVMGFMPPDNTEPSCWLYSCAIRSEYLPSGNVMDMIEALKQESIQARPLFKPNHLQKPYQPFAKGSLHQSEKWYKLGINLPSSASLTRDDQERVIQAFLKALKRMNSG